MSNIFYYCIPEKCRPLFVVDISDYIDQWVEVLKCHHSQFYNTETERYDFVDVRW